MSTTKAYAAFSADAPLGPHTITRRAPSSKDVVIAIKFAGICHSDIHTVREEWGKIKFPQVPGHEIGGVVTEVGSEVTGFHVGDVVGVGCLVDSCRTCQPCRQGEEQYCATGGVFTYGSVPKYHHCAEYHPDGGPITQGGYSQQIVVDQSFVLHIPTNLDLAAATPLLCAGITTYSPLIHYVLQPHHKFAVVGLGGLGHMGVKFAKAFGAHVTVISRGTAKRESALNELGAHAYLDSTDEAALAAHKSHFDFILDTVSAKHDVGALINLLAFEGKLIFVGAPPEPHLIRGGALIGGRKVVGGSLIGGIRQTQEMLDFCGRHNILCDIERINADYINEAYERTVAGTVKYRFVIDVATL